MSETTSEGTDLSMRSVRFALDDIVRDSVTIADVDGTPSDDDELSISPTKPHLDELQGKCAADDDVRIADDIPSVHPILDDDSPLLPWDMAVSPDDMDLPRSQTDFPAVAWSVSRSALTYFTVVVEGIYKWPISVTNREEKGGNVSVMHTLTAIYEDASKIVRRADAEELPPYTRALVYRAREARCRQFSLPLDKEPLRRVDFFMDHRVFRGLSVDYDNLTSRQFTLNIGPVEEAG